ncbi:WD40/YVTN/BNR-like repeat-containing protein [Flavobacterium sp.]|uniref:WD40/YVTN/BNR-like repeat-containing protein n=1 Tax=Flavobacterium sp. TaxID=239 RepID=UPI00374C9B64
MKKIVSILLITSAFCSCITDKNFIKNPRFSKISIDTLLNEKISSRALLIDNNKAWYAGNNGNYGYVSLDSTTNFNGVIAKENLKIEFRSIAQTSKYIFVLSVSNPALLYQIAKDGSQIKLVYQEDHEKVFYDSMQFFNDDEGIAIGDPIEDCPSIIKTSDGGQTWQKISCKKLPKFADGEAFFAASNTNLIIKDDVIWMVSGGKKSRVFHSSDKGETWETVETPIIQGQAMTGIFTADFYDSTIGFIAGGNYEKLEQNFQNKAVTNNGGKTWKLIADKQAFGYASCIQYIPNTGGKAIVAVSATGLYYSRNGGKKWKQLATDKDFLTIRFIDNKTAIVTGKNRIVKISFK